MVQRRHRHHAVESVTEIHAEKVALNERHAWRPARTARPFDHHRRQIDAHDVAIGARQSCAGSHTFTSR
jgi:hypothetical protein